MPGSACLKLHESSLPKFQASSKRYQNLGHPSVPLEDPSVWQHLEETIMLCIVLFYVCPLGYVHTLLVEFPIRKSNICLQSSSRNHTSRQPCLCWTKIQPVTVTPCCSNFSTVPVKNITLILAFTFLNGQAFKVFLQLAWFCVNGTSKSTNSQQVENLSGIK